MSIVCGTSQRTSGDMIDCWKSRVPSQSKRGPHGVLLLFARSTWPRIAGRDQRRPLIHRAVAIDALDRRRVARLAVELAVAVHVHFEMAIDALHSLREMDVLQVNRLREFLRIVVRDFVVAQIEQIAFAVLLEDRAKHPAVAVIVGKLRVLQLRIQLRHFLEKIQVAPQPARGRGFRIALRFDAPARRRSGSLCSFGYMNSPSVS